MLLISEQRGHTQVELKKKGGLSEDSRYPTAINLLICTFEETKNGKLNSGLEPITPVLCVTIFQFTTTEPVVAEIQMRSML